MKIAELKKDMKEYKEDLAKAEELVKTAKYEASTAITKKQVKEATEQLASARKVRDKQKKYLEEASSEIQSATHEKLEELKSAPIESGTDFEINQEKKDSFTEEA